MHSEGDYCEECSNEHDDCVCGSDDDSCVHDTAKQCNCWVRLANGVECPNTTQPDRG